MEWTARWCTTGVSGTPHQRSERAEPALATERQRVITAERTGGGQQDVPAGRRRAAAWQAHTAAAGSRDSPGEYLARQGILGQLSFRTGPLIGRDRQHHTRSCCATTSRSRTRSGSIGAGPTGGRCRITGPIRAGRHQSLLRVSRLRRREPTCTRTLATIRWNGPSAFTAALVVIDPRDAWRLAPGADGVRTPVALVVPRRGPHLGPHRLAGPNSRIPLSTPAVPRATSPSTGTRGFQSLASHHR